MIERLIVTVDDDVSVRESIARLVESAGYATLVFSSAEAVLESGALARADCLVTDVRMPGMDGFELQRRVKTQYPSLPVILISGHVDEDRRGRVLQEGAAGFFYKPFDGEELLRTVENALQRGSQS